LLAAQHDLQFCLPADTATHLRRVPIGQSTPMMTFDALMTA
jgi:hypothetical protein